MVGYGMIHLRADRARVTVNTKSKRFRECQVFCELAGEVPFEAIPFEKNGARLGFVREP
jgi:hypothetical protein